MIHLGGIFRKKRNIFHCCVHKSASQWFLRFFKDEAIGKLTGLKVITPNRDFITQQEKLREFPEIIKPNAIITPVYIKYSDYMNIEKRYPHKTFMVIRDPRDVIISHYFSIKYSHALITDELKNMRLRYNEMSEADGIKDQIESAGQWLYEVLEEWYNGEKNKKGRVRLFRYEDFFSSAMKKTFQELFVFLDIPANEKQLERLLEKYRFQQFSGGRQRGDEDIKSHYRKGETGDWKNYFTKAHKELFKELTGDLLIRLGYEINSKW